MGVLRAVLRYLYGTDARTAHPSEREETDRRFEDALASIDRMKASTERLQRLPPLRAGSIEEALHQIVTRQEVGR